MFHSLRHLPGMRVALTVSIAVAIVLGCSSTDGGGGPEPSGNTGANTGTPRNAGGQSAGTGSESGGVNWNHVQTHWVGSNTDPRYPGSRYLIGVGIAPYVNDQSFQQAEAAGRQRIVAFFEAQIEADFRSVQEEIVSAAQNAPPHVRSESFARSSLREIVQGTLEGGEVADRAVNPERNTAYALVIVNRERLAANLKVQIDELQARIRSTLSQARGHRDRGRFLGALRGYSPIVAWHQELVALVRQYNLAKPAHYPPLSVDFDLTEVLEEMVQVALRLTFAFKIDAVFQPPPGTPTGSLGDVEGAIIGQLRERGIEVSVMRSTPAFRDASVEQIRTMSVEQVRGLLNAEVPVNYVVTGTMTAEHSSDRDFQGTIMPVYRVTYQLEVIELSTNETIPLSDTRGDSLAPGTSHLQAARQAVAYASRRIVEELAVRFSAE